MNGILSKNIIGIKLIKDGFFSLTSKEDDSVIIGSIIHEDYSMKCNTFRNILNEEISNLPNDYKFFSKNGFPIDIRSEPYTEVSQLINASIVTIQRSFDPPRLGIQWQNGQKIGFIFINFNTILTEVRKAINFDLNGKFLHFDSKFEFLDKNGWPISSLQEKYLIVWDICNQNTCSITKTVSKRKYTFQDIKYKKKCLKLTDKKELESSKSDQLNTSTSILISYVHAEALMHARDLKRELINMGIDSVFLDVDDILAGQDWQDVINSALNNCLAFVALVTPRYGETRWTNREAKLADDKEKLIIPVSFLNKWPPDQLAIQFLSLQYIPWILKDDFSSDGDFLAANDITKWNQRCVHRVAKEIKALCSTSEICTPDSSSLLEPRLPTEKVFSPISQQSNTKKHLIIISAHREQQKFVEKLKNSLEEDYYIWLSINDSTENDEVFNTNEDSQLSSNSPFLEPPSHVKNIYRYNQNSYLDCLSRGASNWKDSTDSTDFISKKSEFKKMVKNSSLMILINSEEYTHSRHCKQEAFYCEQRVGVIVIKYGDVQTDNLLQNLYPVQDMLDISHDDIENICNGDYHNNFIINVKKEVVKALESSKNKNSYKDNIQKKVADLKKEIGAEFSVYIIGGTNSVSKNAETFCINLGSELAKIQNLTLVTEGFFGAGDLVGKNFCEEKEIVEKGKPLLLCHVVPVRDSNPTKRARQSDDGSFEKIPYGQTLFYGNSITERDDIVSATFKICILIEGGERSASLAEKFLWNDCIVVPILFNNRAISSKVCLSASISKAPLGVSQKDWSKLNNYLEVEELANTVRRIIMDLKTRIKYL